MSDYEKESMEQRTVSRRQFLKIAGIAGASVGAMGGLGGLLAACGGDEETTTTTAAAATTTTAGSSETTAATEGATTTVAASVEEGRVIKIGAVSPITGSLASFGGPDKWIVSYVLNAVKDGVVAGDGKLHQIEIEQLDTQSSPNRVAEVAADLIFNTKVDMMVASSSPDTVNPAAEQAEANGVPFLANFVPWQPFYFGRGATVDTGYTWTWMFHFGIEDAAECRLGMWNQIETNKQVALLFANDADGQSWANPDTGLGSYLAKDGYTVVSQPDLYPPGAEDYTTQIAEFKKSGAEVLSGVQVPPDFTNFWKQSYQQGYRPKIMSIAKAALFHSSVEALGDIALGWSDHMVWHPKFPYASLLTGQTCQEYADQYTADTGNQWTQPLGQLGKYEWAVDILKRWDPDNKDQFPEVVKVSKFDCINGPVDFTQPVQMGTTRPVPNVFKIKIAGGQWGKAPEGSPFQYDIYIVYGQDPNMPIEKEFEEMPYVV